MLHEDRNRLGQDQVEEDRHRSVERPQHAPQNSGAKNQEWLLIEKAEALQPSLQELKESRRRSAIDDPVVE